MKNLFKKSSNFQSTKARHKLAAPALLCSIATLATLAGDTCHAKGESSAAAAKAPSKPSSPASAPTRPVLSKSASQQVAPNSSASKTKLVDGYRLTEHSDFRGKIVIDVCPQGLRLQSREIFVLMSPESKSGYMVHEENKRYLMMTTDAGSKKFGHMSRVAGPEKVVKVGDEVMCGLPVTHYYIEKFAYRDDGKLGATPYWMTDVWVCNSIGLSKEFARNCANLCMLPGEFGLPVKVVRVYRAYVRKSPQTAEQRKDLERQYGKGLMCLTNPKYEADISAGNLKNLLELRSATKIKMDPERTRLPKGFKKVTTEVDLVTSEKDDALLKELD